MPKQSFFITANPAFHTVSNTANCFFKTDATVPTAKKSQKQALKMEKPACRKTFQDKSPLSSSDLQQARTGQGGYIFGSESIRNLIFYISVSSFASTVYITGRSSPVLIFYNSLKTRIMETPSLHYTNLPEN